MSKTKNRYQATQRESFPRAFCRCFSAVTSVSNALFRSRDLQHSFHSLRNSIPNHLQHWLLRRAGIINQLSAGVSGSFFLLCAGRKKKSHSQCFAGDFRPETLANRRVLCRGTHIQDGSVGQMEFQPAFAGLFDGVSICRRHNAKRSTGWK